MIIKNIGKKSVDSEYYTQKSCPLRTEEERTFKNKKRPSEFKIPRSLFYRNANRSSSTRSKRILINIIKIYEAGVKFTGKSKFC